MFIFHRQITGEIMHKILDTCNGNDIETKAERSFDLEFVFDIEAKRTCLFQNL
jgi:hypothetical protein